MGATNSQNETGEFRQKTTETQRIVFIRVQPNPVQIYQEGIILCKQDRYIEALERFLTVMKMRPDFPNIGLNVIQCTLLAKALKIYQEGRIKLYLGIVLLKMGRTVDALKRFEYIEEELQSDFKDCRQLIVACRKKVWIEQLEHSILFQMISQQQQQQGPPPEIQMIQSFFELLTMIGQARRNQNHDDEEESQNKQEEEPDFDSENLDKLPIYYICQKKPQCQYSSNGQKPFRHSNCGTFAYFHASGMISCDDGCDEYSISNALFSCGNQEVSNSEDQQDDDDYEIIKEQKLLADFVEDCLCKDKHNESLKNQFRMGVAGGAFIEMLKNN